MKLQNLLCIAAATALITSAQLKAATSTWSLTLTSANGGADTLFSWSCTGPISFTRTSPGTVWQQRYPWQGKASANLVTVSGPSAEAYSGFDPDYDGDPITLVTGLNTGLFFTNTTTGASAAFDKLLVLPQWGQFQLGLDLNAPLYQNPGETIVLSGPTTGSFLSGVAFSDFNEGQWIFDLPDANYSYDSILTVAGIPEPTSALLSALGATGMLLRRRKR